MSARSAGLRRVRVGAAIVAVLLGVGLVGCGSQSAEPSPLDQSEDEGPQKNSGKDQAGDDEPEEPADPEEYIFVKKYVEAMNEAMKTGDASAMRDLSTEDCRGCTTLADFQEELHGNGGKYLDDPSFEVVELVDGPDGQDPTWVRIAKKQPKVAQVQEEGGPETQVGGITDYSEFGLVKEEGEWKVAEFCGVTESQPQGCPS